MRVSTPSRPLDHVVLPVIRLSTARARLTALGFTVAPDGTHPFGTANCCVYLSDGTFLEPLAVADEKAAAGSIEAGNVFAARDADHRRAHGENGFSALVFGSDDADRDYRLFGKAGISAGPILEFSRQFVDAGGREDIASFRLAFAADKDAPDVFFFSCQRLNAPAVDRSALQQHANGALGLSHVLLSAADPMAHAGLVAELTGSEARTASEGSLEASAGRSRIVVSMPAALEEVFGIHGAAGAALHAAGLVFTATDLIRLHALLHASSVEFHRHDGRVIVLPAPGQGAAFVFEEAT
jgi:hypothetical protein